MKPEATKEDLERAKRLFKEFGWPAELSKQFCAAIAQALAEVRAEKVQFPSEEDMNKEILRRFRHNPEVSYGFQEGIDWLKANTKGVEEE